MLFLIVLVAAYTVVAVVSHGSAWTQRDRWRLALAVGMAVAGLSHLLMPAPFVQHIPPSIPAHEEIVFASGIIEMLFAPALLLRGDARRWAGIALGVFLVAVFPGNVYVAVAGIDVAGQPDGMYPWLRLVLQPLFIWLALWSTGAGGLLSTVAARRHRRTLTHAR